MRFAFAFAVACGVGCSQNGPPPGGDAGGGAPDLATTPADLAPPPPDLSPTASGVGDPCTGAAFTQGTCMNGLECLPPDFGFPEGYCSAICDAQAPCPSDAQCRMTMGGALCFLKCKADADCRTPLYGCVRGMCLPVNNGGGVPPGTNDGGACVTPIVTPGQGLAGPFGKNVQISGSGMSIEAECELAVDATGEKIVVSWNDLTSGGPIGASGSANGGVTWSPQAAIPGNKLVDGSRQQSDPVVAVDAQGNFWASDVGFDLGQGGTTNMRAYAFRSTNGGLSFDDAFVASPAADTAPGASIDKPWIAVSPLDDAIWVTYMHAPNQAGPIDIRFARSPDHGMSWQVQTVSDTQQRPNVDRNLAQIAIGPDGKGVVAWVEIGQEQFGSPSNRVYLQRIDADGTKNGANVLVTRAPDSPTFEDPSVAVAGTNVYVGFVSGTPDGKWDVRVAASLDGGASFSPSVKVNDDATCATHFHHQIATDAKGNVHAIWYDNRYLAGNVFYAESGPADAMNPLAFGKNLFVNDAPFTFTTRRDMANWIGDYLGLAVAGGEIFAVWTDNRVGDRSHIFFASGKLP